MEKTFSVAVSLVVIIIALGFVYAETCDNVGDIVGDQFCNEYGVYQNLKAGGETCLNDYECYADSCLDGVCQSRYESFSERTKFLQDVWNYFSGEECDPTYDTDYSCVGTVAYLCGQNYVWEEKGEIPGICGVPLTSGGNNETPGDGNNNNNNPGGSSSLGRIEIGLFSPQNKTYSSFSIPLNVIDKKKNAEYWRYSLNGGNDVGFTPNTTITATSGKNTLVISASRYSSFSSQVTKTVIFTVNPSSIVGICGDKVCDSDESCSVCSSDCGECPAPSSYCGDNVCDADESSSICPVDCPAAVRHDKMWLFYILVVILAGGFLFVTFLLGKRLGFINFPKQDGDGSSPGGPTKPTGPGPAMPVKNVAMNQPMPAKPMPQKPKSM